MISRIELIQRVVCLIDDNETEAMVCEGEMVVYARKANIGEAIATRINGTHIKTTVISDEGGMVIIDIIDGANNETLISEEEFKERFKILSFKVISGNHWMLCKYRSNEVVAIAITDDHLNRLFDNETMVDSEGNLYGIAKGVSEEFIIIKSGDVIALPLFNINIQTLSKDNFKAIYVYKSLDGTIDEGIILTNYKYYMDVIQNGTCTINNKKEKEMKEKTLNVKNSKDLKEKVSDVEIFGPDLFLLASKASSKSQGWMKSTKVCNMANGCMVQVSTQNIDNVSEALQFIPDMNYDFNSGYFKPIDFELVFNGSCNTDSESDIDGEIDDDILCDCDAKSEDFDIIKEQLKLVLVKIATIARLDNDEKATVAKLTEIIDTIDEEDYIDMIVETLV